MILIIDKHKKIATDLSDAFLGIGVLARGCTPREALSEISTMYRAVIITSPRELADPADFVKRVSSYCTIPIFAINDSPVPLDFIDERMQFGRGSYAYKILERIIEYFEERGENAPGHYALAGIDASYNLKTPSYFWTELPFTKTETMILRLLIRSYPIPTSAEKILTYAYRTTRIPDVSNIRTHISVMNKKFREITGRNIFELNFGAGYRILTPEIIAASNN